MKRLLKNKKALSPVVAAIILIAVTVAVSIAVAAWMGSLTIGFMETSGITINQMEFSSANNNINVTMINSGTNEVTIGMVKVNGNTMAVGSGGDVTRIDTTPSTTDLSFTAGETATIMIDYSAIGVADGQKYSVNFFKPDGTLIGSFTDTA